MQVTQADGQLLIVPKFTEVDRARLKVISSLMPGTVTKAVRGYALYQKKAICKTIAQGGGRDNVDPFGRRAEITKAFDRQKAWDGRWGGRPMAEGKGIGVWLSGSAVRLGYRSQGLADLAAKFQSAEQGAWADVEMFIARRHGYRGHMGVYDRPARPFMEQFAVNSIEEMPAWVLNRAEKLVASKFKTAKVVAKKLKKAKKKIKQQSKKVARVVKRQVKSAKKSIKKVAKTTKKRSRSKR